MGEWRAHNKREETKRRAHLMTEKLTILEANKEETEMQEIMRTGQIL